MENAPGENTPQQQPQIEVPVVDQQLVDRAAEQVTNQVVGKIGDITDKVMGGIGQLAQRASDFQGDVTRAKQELNTTTGLEKANIEAFAGTLAVQLESKIMGAGDRAADRLAQGAADVEQRLSAVVTRADEATTSVRGVVNEASGAIARAESVADEVDRLRQALSEDQRDVARKIMKTLIEEQNPAALRLQQEVKASSSPQHEHMPLLRVAVKAGVPVWLHGEAGSGKSTAARIAAAELALPFRSRVFGPTTSEASLMGYRDANGNYHSTGFREIVEEGGVFLFDEIDNTNPGILTAMNGVLANGEGEFPDGLIKNHDNTRFVAAANTIGRGATAQYVGRNRIDASTLDRFAFLPWNTDWGLTEALSLDLEQSPTRPADPEKGGSIAPDEWLQKVRAYSNEASRLGIKLLVSPRAALLGRQLLQAGMGEYWTTEMLLHKGLDEASKQKLETAVNGTRY